MCIYTVTCGVQDGSTHLPYTLFSILGLRLPHVLCSVLYGHFKQPIECARSGGGLDGDEAFLVE